MSGSPPKGSSISQSSTLEYSRNACSRGRPLMLITISACSQTSGEILLDSRPSAPYPFLMSVCLVNPTTKPSGAKPALNASIASGASRRAIASAIGLRQALPIQTNKTLVRPSFLVIGRFLSKNQLLAARGPCASHCVRYAYTCSARLQEPPYETHAIPCPMSLSIRQSPDRVWGSIAGKGEEHQLPPTGIMVQIQTPELPLLCVKANTVNPHGARNLVIQLVANRPDSPHEQ